LNVRRALHRTALPLALGIILIPAPSSAQVERLKPRNLSLRTSMNPTTHVYHYAPPEAAGEGTDDRAAAPKSKESAPVLFISGAWGWRPMLQDTASFLAAEGRHVLGIDAPSYFKKLVRPEELREDLRTFRTTLNERAGRPADAPVLMAGFDMGAENLPYLLNRAGTAGVIGLLLIAPKTEGTAVFRVAIRLDMPLPAKEHIDVAAEISALPPMPAVLMQGGLDDKAAARDLARLLKGQKLFAGIPGASHNFREMRGAYMRRVEEALQWLERRAARRPRRMPRPEPWPPEPPADTVPD
jgi:type IV secretory pathway VirJ component